jgi:hypothetical protein
MWMERGWVSPQQQVFSPCWPGGHRCHLTIMAQEMLAISLQVELDVISMSYSVPGSRHGVACIIMKVSLNRDEPWAENKGKFTPNTVKLLCMTQLCFRQDLEWRHWHPICSRSPSLGSWFIQRSYQVPLLLFLSSWCIRENVSDIMILNDLFQTFLSSQWCWNTGGMG